MSQQTSTSETIVALYLALKERDSCEICRGKSERWHSGARGVRKIACECSNVARYVLEKYKEKFEANAVVYLATQGIPSDGNIQPEILMNELFKNVR